MSDITRQRVNGPSQHEGANAQATVRNEVVTVVGTERGTVDNSIPEDVMQTAEAAYLASLHDSMSGKPDYLKHVALAILAERDGWHGIESAPKHFKPILACDVVRGYDAIVVHNGAEWELLSHDGFPMGVGFYPTHWRSLPKPPVSSPNATEDHHHD